MPIIRRLATAPCRHLELRTAAGCGAGDVEAAEVALSRLHAFRLIDSVYLGGRHQRGWWTLTASGHDLLEPLARLASWYGENRGELEKRRAEEVSWRPVAAESVAVRLGPKPQVGTQPVEPARDQGRIRARRIDPNG